MLSFLLLFAAGAVAQQQMALRADISNATIKIGDAEWMRASLGMSALLWWLVLRAFF
jgi:hypothetical protein